MTTEIRKYFSKAKNPDGSEGALNMPLKKDRKNPLRFKIGNSTIYSMYLIDLYNGVLKSGYGVNIKFTSYPDGRIIQVKVESGSNKVEHNHRVTSLNKGLEKYGIELVDENKKDIENVLGTKILIDGDQTIIIKNIEALHWQRENAIKDFKTIMVRTVYSNASL